MALPPGVSIADADAYFATTPRDADWTAVTDKQIWLNEAYRWLAQLCMDPTKECCGLAFADAWIAANSELALALSKAPGAIIGGGATSSSSVKRNKLGDLEQEFFAPSEGRSGSKYDADDPLVLQRFPWLSEIIGCYLLHSSTSGPRVISRVRS